MKKDIPHDPEARSRAELILQGSPLGIFTTADDRGQPHATWMSSFNHETLNEVLTITSPDSEKIQNLKVNPQAEWMFTSAEKDVVLYLTGPAAIVEDVVEIKRYWSRIPDKTQAYFLKFYNTGIGFAVIRMQVEDITLVYPREFRKVRA